MSNQSSTSSEAEFTSAQVDFIVAVEQLWWGEAAIPTDEKIAQLTGLSLPEISRYWKMEHVRGAMTHRGIDLTPRTTGLLTITQLDLVNLLLNFADKRSLREKLAHVNVSMSQYNTWMRKPAFRDYLTRRAEETFKSADAEAYNALIESVRAQDMKAIQLFFEMRGIYNPRVQVDVVNVQGVLVKVVDIISRHVHDPVVLQNIAEEFQALGIGTETSAVADPLQLPIEAVIVESPIPQEPVKKKSAVAHLPKNEFDFKL